MHAPLRSRGWSCLLPRWGAVITAKSAHVNVDENGAPERISGLKLLPIETPDGKLTPELIDQEAWGWGDEHRAQPAAHRGLVRHQGLEPRTR
jgi:threonine aldolase